MSNVQYGYDQPGSDGRPPANYVAAAPVQQRVDNGYQSSCTKSGILGLAIAILLVTLACASCEVAQIVIFRTTDLLVIPIYAYGGLGSLIWFIITGIIGIVSARASSKGWVIAFMVLNILSCALFIWPVISLGSASLVLAKYVEPAIINNYGYSDAASYIVPSSHKPSLIATSAIIVTASVILFILSLTASIMGCATVCCGTPTPLPVQSVYAAPPYVSRTELQPYGQQQMMSTTAVYSVPPAAIPQYREKA